MHGYGRWECTNKKECGCFPLTVWERGYRADITRERGLQGEGFHTSTGLPDAARVLQPANRRSAPACWAGTGETHPHSQGCDSSLLHLSDTCSAHVHLCICTDAQTQSVKGCRKHRTATVRSGSPFSCSLSARPPRPPVKCIISQGWALHSPPAEDSRSKDKDSDPLEEKAESTEDTPDSLLPLLADGSLHAEELRPSSSGPSRVWEMPESSWDSSSERLWSLSKVGAEARLSGVATGACRDSTQRG